MKFTDYKKGLIRLLESAQKCALDKQAGWGSKPDLKIKVPTETGQLTLTLYAVKPAISHVLDKARKQRIRSYGCPKMPLREPDYGDVALDIYGDAATAAAKLQAQLDRADELELEDYTRIRLGRVIEDLAARAKATADLERQRSAVVQKLIQEKAFRECMVAAQGHPLFSELQKAVTEFQKKWRSHVGFGYGQENNVLAVRVWGKPGVGKIEKLVDKICHDLHLHRDRRTKKWNFYSYSPREITMDEVCYGSQIPS